MKEVKNVSPFAFAYTVFNKTEREIYGVFSCLEDAVEFINARFEHHPYGRDSISYTYEREPDYKHLTYSFDRFKRGYITEYYSASPWLIYTESGIIQEDAVKDAKRRIRIANYHGNKGWETRLEQYAMHDKRMVIVKGSGDKIKSNSERLADTKAEDTEYSRRVWGYFRTPKTAQERRKNVGHIDEYGESFVRGRRRNLPDAWDDIANSRMDTERSWKHHSKRKKQWKPLN